MNTEVLIPALVVAVGFVAFCLVDLYRSGGTRYLPKWAWGLICLVSIPLGGVIYLLLGRSRQHV